MSYIDREKELLEKMGEQNYSKFFDGDKSDAFDEIESALSAFTDYANVVVREQVMLPIWRSRFEGKEYQDHVVQIDMDRRLAHNAAIDKLNMLNRICAAYGARPFAEIDTNDRYAVADMIGDFVIETYNAGTGRKGIDGATLDRREEYDSKKIRERMQMIDDALPVTPGSNGEYAEKG